MEIRCGSIRALAPAFCNLLHLALHRVSALSVGWEEDSFTSVSSQHIEEERSPFQWLPKATFLRSYQRNFSWEHLNSLNWVTCLSLSQSLWSGLSSSHLIGPDWVTCSSTNQSVWPDVCHALVGLGMDLWAIHFDHGREISLRVIKPIPGAGAGVISPEGVRLCPLSIEEAPDCTCVLVSVAVPIQSLQ